jgi:hypothetical protein
LASPAAVLSILIQAEGFAETNRKLRNIQDSAERTSKSTDTLSKRFKDLDGEVTKFNRNFTATGNAIKLVKFPALIAGAGAAAQAIGALAAGGVALGSALAPLVGLGAAAAAGLTAAAQGAGTFALATAGIADALKEQIGLHTKLGPVAASSAKAEEAGAKAVKAAQEGVRTAKEGVRQATQGVQDAVRGETVAHEGLVTALKNAREAQAALTTARFEAKRSLEDQRSALVDAMLSESSATLALRDARRALADLTSGPSLAALATAHETVTDAVRGQQHAVLALADAQAALDALLKGPTLLDAADAHDAVTDAIRGEERARLDLIDAQKKANAVLNDPKSTEDQKARARLELADAQNAVGDAARATARAQERLKALESPPLERDLAKARLAVADAENAVGDAATGTTQAREALAQLEAGPGADEIAKARLAVKAAEVGVSEAIRTRQRAQQDLNKAEKAGIAGSPQVVSAQQAIADANKGVVEAQRGVADAARATADAQRNLAEAQRGVVTATQAVADAQKSAGTSADGAAAKMGNLSAKFDALPPAAQAFVRVLLSLKPKLDALRATASAGLLPGAAKGLLDASKNFGVVNKIVDLTARAMGRLAERAGALVGSSGFGKDLETVGRRNVTIIEHVGNAAITLADALRHVVVAAGPLTLWLARLSEKGADWILAQVKAGRESGKLAAFLERTRAVMTTLGRSAFNLAAGLLNIGHAATPLGNDLLDKFEKLTKRFREWTDSASGRNQIAAYFQNAKGPLLETFGLIGDIAGALLRISTGKGATPLIAQLRTLVPIFEQVVTSTTAAFGPALIDALGNLLRLFGQIAGANGPLIQMVKLIGLIAGGLADLLGSTPALRSMTTSFIGLYGAAKALAFVFGPLVAGAKLFEAALIGQATAATVAKTATLGERAALVATAVAMYAARAATIAMTVATVALDTALAVLTSPITLVIAALALLAAGIIYAYRHSETFRKIVNAMWATLKVVAAWMITAGVAAFNAVATAAKVAWGIVKTVTTTVWGGIRTFLTGLWSGLQTSATAVFTAIRTVVGVEFGAIKAIASTVWSAVRAAILTPIREARDALGGKDGIWAQIRGTAEAAWGKLKSGVANFAGDVKDGVIKAFEGAVNTVIDFVQKIIDVVWLIPGLGKKPKIGHIGGGGGGGGGSKSDPRPHKRAKGGMVPGSGYGDKVPLHIAGKLAAMVEPGELVSVANRNATAALMGVNSAIPRFNTGGILNTQEMSDLWRSKGGNSSIADTMGVIGLVESGGKPWAHNPSGASGLWQILGQLVPGNIFNPGVNALNAIAKYKAAGLRPWDASKSKWEPLIGKKVGPNPLDLIGKLPGVGGLPDWLKGTGKYVLDKVGAWIKDNVVKAVTGGGGPIESGPNGVGTFEGVPMANWVIGSLKYGRRHGAFGNPTSGYRPGFDPHTATGSSEHQGTRYPHGAVDFGGYHDARALAEKLSYVHATAGYKYPLLAPKGFVDDGHASGTGHMRGGVLPFLGSYHTGGVAPREGIAHVAAGERMTPAGRGGPLVNIEHAEFKSGTDINSFAARIGFKIATA